jgi:membrane fusion protein (multidrug efflux system)/multidrug efflux system membrane fusion protein
MVPQQGVTHNEQGKATALILDQENVVQLRDINAVQAVGNQWLVTTGLRPGDRVIVSGLQRIRPGIKARVLSSHPNSPDTVTKQ